MASALIDGIRTRYEVLGSGPAILMYAPGGFDATIDKWRSQGVYQRVKLLEHLPKAYRCVVFDRRECGESGGRVELEECLPKSQYWDALPEQQNEANAAARLAEFLGGIAQR